MDMAISPRRTHRVALGAGCLFCAGAVVFCSRSDLSSVPNGDGGVAGSEGAAGVRALSCSTARRWYQLQSGTALTLKSVVGDEDGTVWAVGQEGVILANDGRAWRIDTVLGVSVLDTIALGPTMGLIAAGWNVEGGSRTHVYRRDGNAWKRLDPGFNGKPRGLLVTESNIQVLGTYINQGRIWTWVDGTWTEEPLGYSVVREAAELGPNTLVALAEDYDSLVVVRHDQAWSTEFELPDSTRLNEVVVHSDGSLTVVGRASSGKGLVLQGQPSKLEQLEVGERELRSVSALSSSNIYAVGDDGTIAHYDGKDWRLMDSGTTEWLYGVWASADTLDVFAVGAGGTILEYACPDRLTFESRKKPPEAPPCSELTVAELSGVELYGAWGYGLDDFFVAASPAVFRLRGAKPELAWTRPRIRLNAMRGNSDAAYAVGRDGDTSTLLVVRCDANACRELPIGIGGQLLSVWAGDDGNVVAAGNDMSALHSLVVHLRGDTEEWEVLPSIGPVNIEELWGNALTDLWGSGTDWGGPEPVGVVVHFDGARWTREAEVPKIEFHAFSGSGSELYAGGRSAVPDENGRLGSLLRHGSNNVWGDIGLDPRIGIQSLYAASDRLLAGVFRAIPPTEERVLEWVDLTDPSRPKTLCTLAKPIEDIVELHDGSVIALDQSGPIYLAE